MAQGDTRIFRFGPVSDLQNNWVDLSGGASAIWRIAKSRYSKGPDILLTKTSPDITFTSDIYNGDVRWYVTVTLTPSDTANLLPCVRPTIWFHQLRITDSGGNVATIASGLFDLQPSPAQQVA